MIAPAHFLKTLQHEGFEFFTGVPDSLMKSLLLEIDQKSGQLIAANEGAALATAAGYYLATGKAAVVYLQNSGLGNLVNPATSLVNETVYDIPALLLVGWRGEPGVKDEPQHQKMGSITTALLELLDIPCFILEKDEDWQTQVAEACRKVKEENKRVALLVRDGIFSHSTTNVSEVAPVASNYELDAETVLSALYEKISSDWLVVATTGKLARLFYALNKGRSNFPGVWVNAGAMGHSNSLAAALARFSEKNVLLLDGDGSLLMHMGSLAIIGQQKLPHLHYVLLNNGAHVSVGGQPTVGFEVEFCKIALGCGFKRVHRIETRQIMMGVDWFQGGAFIEFRINGHIRESLPRPTEQFVEFKNRIRQQIKK